MADIAQRVGQVEQVAVVDFAGTRFIAAGCVGQLHVAYTRQVRAQGAGQLSLHPLRVVDVVQQEQVVCAHFIEDGQRLARAVDEEAGHVEMVDGLQQHPHALLACSVGCKPQVAHQRVMRLGCAYVGGRDTCHAMQLWRAQRGGIVQGLGHTGAELVDAVGQCSQPPVARSPVSGGHVVQHQLQLVVLQALGDFLWREVVGKQKFNGLEARARSGGKAVQEGQLGVKHGEVGGKFRHGFFHWFARVFSRANPRSPALAARGSRWPRTR